MKTVWNVLSVLFIIGVLVAFFAVVFSAGYGKAIEDRCAEHGYGYKNGECIQVVDIDSENG